METAPDQHRPRFDRLLAISCSSALLAHTAEAAVAYYQDNAFLDCLPSSVRLTYLLLVVLSFFALGAISAVVSWLISRPLPRLGQPIAAVVPPAFLAVELLRHIDELRGSAAPALASMLLLLAVALLFLCLKRNGKNAAQPAPSGYLLFGFGAVLFLVVSSNLPESLIPETADADHSSPTSNTAATAIIPPADNLLVLLVDTLRADHLSTYGYGRETSPHIDNLANNGTLFENFLTPQPKTSPAIASLFTGLYPDTHLIKHTSCVLPPEQETLAELLSDRGLSTFGISANVNISRTFGFDQGFDQFVYLERLKNSEGVLQDKNAFMARDTLIEWLQNRDNDRFFAYVQFIDPHSKYRPPPPFDSMFRGDDHYGQFGTVDLPVISGEYMDAINRDVFLSEAGGNLDEYVSRYDGEIRATDTAIGDIMKYLDESGLSENTIVVFTADHGESLTEHNAYFNHGLFPYEEQVHIPLVIRGPGIAVGKRRPETASLVGLMPTILELLGFNPPDQIEEASFASLLSASTPETRGTPQFLTARSHRSFRIFGVREGSWKFLMNPRGTAPDRAFTTESLLLPGKRFLTDLSRHRNYEIASELYDLEADPQELTNLAYREPMIAARLSKLVDDYRTQQRRSYPEPVKLSEKHLKKADLEELRRLGYLGR